MKNLPPIFFTLLLFLILIKALLPVFIILAVVGVIAFIITTIINQKKSKELEKQRKLKEQASLERKAKQGKIQKIHDKCSRFTSLINEETLTKQEKALNSAQSVISRSIYDKPFIDINIRRNQAKYDIFKYALTCIDSIKRDSFTDDMLLKLDGLIAEYDRYRSGNDGFFISDFQKAEFEKLKSEFENVRNKCFNMLTSISYSSTLNLCSGQRKCYNYNHECFLNVHSNEKIIHLYCHNVSLYLYPLFIVEVNNDENFVIHNWRELSFDIHKIRAYTKGYGSELKGAVELCHSYEHTCIDGTPDMRYKKNDIYRTYRVCQLTCKQIPSFNFIVANETLANGLLHCFNQYTNLKESKNCADIRNQNNDDYTIYSSLFNELDNVISEYGVEIISSKKLFYIMSDLGCFKNDTKLRLLFRDMTDDNIMDLFLNSYITQSKLEDLALIYSYKYNYSIDDCLTILNKVKGIVSKHRVKS